MSVQISRRRRCLPCLFRHIEECCMQTYTDKHVAVRCVAVLSCDRMVRLDGCLGSCSIRYLERRLLRNMTYTWLVIPLVQKTSYRCDPLCDCDTSPLLLNGTGRRWKVLGRCLISSVRPTHKNSSYF